MNVEEEERRALSRSELAERTNPFHFSDCSVSPKHNYIFVFVTFPFINKWAEKKQKQGRRPTTQSEQMDDKRKRPRERERAGATGERQINMLLLKGWKKKTQLSQ